MNKDQFEGKWHQIKGEVKKQWGKLTDNEITEINGKCEKLCGKLQEKYGYSKEKAEQEVNSWCSKCNKSGSCNQCKCSDMNPQGKNCNEKGCCKKGPHGSSGKFGEEGKDKKRKAS